MSSKRFSGDKLRTVRKARSMTSTELGAAIGCAMDTIGTWERGTFVPKLDAFYALQEVLDCEADDLLNDEDPASKPGLRTAVSLGTSTSRVGRDRRVER